MRAIRRKGKMKLSTNVPVSRYPERRAVSTLGASVLYAADYTPDALIAARDIAVKLHGETAERLVLTRKTPVRHQSNGVLFGT